jgi:uncharacterized protein YdeI (BOF family)
VKSLGDNVNGGKVMKHLIVVTGLMLIATRAFAGESDFEGVNNCAGKYPDADGSVSPAASGQHVRSTSEEDHGLL